MDDFDIRLAIKTVDCCSDRSDLKGEFKNTLIQNAGKKYIVALQV